MAETRECPMCGGTMRIRRTERPVHVPGNPRPSMQIATEWICPDCDYFEDSENDRM